MQKEIRNYKNRMSSAQGRHFEMMIQKACEYYRIKGDADVEKIPEPFLVIKKHSKNSFTGKFIGKAQPDFQGTLKGGKSIVFEAKHTTTDRIKASVLTKAQYDYLESHFLKGATVGVCVNVKSTYAFVPWLKWRIMKELYGRKYMTEDDLQEFRVQTPGMVLFLDYL